MHASTVTCLSFARHRWRSVEVQSVFIRSANIFFTTHFTPSRDNIALRPHLWYLSFLTGRWAPERQRHNFSVQGLAPQVLHLGVRSDLVPGHVVHLLHHIDPLLDLHPQPARMDMVAMDHYCPTRRGGQASKRNVNNRTAYQNNMPQPLCNVPHAKILCH